MESNMAEKESGKPMPVASMASSPAPTMASIPKPASVVKPGNPQSYVASLPAFPVRHRRWKVKSCERHTLLPTDYEVRKYDVINGRGRRSYNHIGNRRFRQMATMNLKRYFEAPTKMDKSMVVYSLVKAMREACPSGGFLKKDKDTNRWISIGETEAREKVGHCLRDMIASSKEDPRLLEAEDVIQAETDTSVFEDPAHPNMSAEQIRILQILEEGYVGGVEELIGMKTK